MNRSLIVRALAVLALGAVAVLPSAAAAAALPSGERMLGNATVEPAYDDFDGSVTYLLTQNRLAPLNPTNPIGAVNPHAVSPLYLIVYPPGTAGTFDCMGDPGNCPDHDGAIAGLATTVKPGVYGAVAAAVPGHDHLVGLAHTGDFNVAWRVYVELFNSAAAVRHITTLAGLQAAWSAGDLTQVDTGITFVCSVVSASAYNAGTPA